MNIFIFFIALGAILSCGNSARILVVYPLPGRSHYILGNAVTRTLVEAGHDVTMISPFKEKNPSTNGSWTDIILTGLFEDSKKTVMANFFEMESALPIINLPVMASLGNMITERTLSHPAVQDLLKSDAEFDVVIVEQFNNDGLKGLAYHFNAPLILVSSLGANPWVNPLVGNPAPPSYIPDIFLSYSSKMTFCERVKNTLFIILGELNRHLFFFPAQNQLMKKYIPGVPDLSILNYNVSLILMNSHVSTNQPKPLVPAMVEIGGYHINPPKKLPKDLQEYLDNAKDGVIYFSMGSNLKSALMPELQKNAILNSLSKLKQKVLWKFEDDELPGKPQNVKIGKWLPQQDILAHPNVKLFITHGGLLSTTETIYHGKPVLAIPIFGDQKVNAAQIKLSGFGLSVSFGDLTEEKVTNALNELLTNPKYYENAQNRMRILHDRQVPPKESLVYWVEHIIRHGGGEHLRVSALELTWYQYILLDVFAFLAIVSIIGLYITCKSIKFIIKKCKKPSLPVNKKKVKKN